MDKSTVEKKIPLAYQVIKDMGKSNFVPVTLEGKIEKYKIINDNFYSLFIYIIFIIMRRLMTYTSFFIYFFLFSNFMTKFIYIIFSIVLFN